MATKKSGGKLNAKNAGSSARKISKSVSAGAKRSAGKANAIISTGAKKSKGGKSLLDGKGMTKKSQKAMANTAARQSSGPASGKGKRGWRPKNAK